ncbi:hypothetical protein DVR12_25360 [Chitinophaga silvatica]|uniref:DUF1835 domain-containing protein n=2 Tax=Chitinophaga silvatica TaxID=2282649 RepID=A0A3E1Y2L8_9BACT|nr:hypothetical protein DVR12_25360 [Chitinophaga silvatica]
MRYLHVLNGDSALTLFRQSEVSGEIIICREMMCEGKVKYTNNLSAFFESRAKHLQYHYGIDRKTYYSHVVRELEKMVFFASSTDEIVLWFEYDLFSQVNLLFILHFIANSLFDKQLPISIVDLPHHPTAEDLPKALNKRILLQSDDLALAADIWDAWCMDTPMLLETISKMSTGNLKYIPAAITAHLKRFPDAVTGLSIIESYFLLQLALGSYRWYELYMLFWRDLEIYGFSNFQLDVLVHRMVDAGVIDEREQLLIITSLGQEVLDEQENYLDYVSLEHRWLGGVRLSTTPWRWDQSRNTLVEVEK